MKMLVKSVVLLAALGASIPALAQDAPEPEFTLNGNVALVTDYRFRGVSMSDKGFAVQGGLGVAHKSGLYAGFWASSLAGWGTFGGPNVELDLFGGITVPLGAGTLDVGLTWYMYPGGAKITDFAEPYVKISGDAGPVSLLAGVAYAPSQESLGNWFATPTSRLGDKEDNLYVWGDAAYAVKDTPLTLKAHLGYSDGNPGLGPNGTSVAPTGSYWDWSLGATVDVGPVTLGVSYVDTDISTASAAYNLLQPNFSSTKDGSTISGSKVLFSVGAAF
ncbi:TorF family putative porin [Polymorphobacter sp.]|uniref:TorF family putative porin n=1 Tax=Polymorphobacter sp. TaxID=1909290 RepID=UPI003F72957D